MTHAANIKPCPECAGGVRVYRFDQRIVRVNCRTCGGRGYVGKLLPLNQDELLVRTAQAIARRMTDL